MSVDRISRSIPSVVGKHWEKIGIPLDFILLKDFALCVVADVFDVDEAAYV